MAKTFTCFPRLPPELRRMIWKFCIPRRVVELQFPVQGILAPTNCSFVWTNNQISVPPLITQVCCEARSVALENGGLVLDYAEDVDVNFNWKSTDAWFSPKYDIVTWYWRPEQQVDYELEVIGDPLAYFVHLALQAQGALILAQHIYPCRYLEPSGDGPPPLEEVELKHLTRLKSIMVCVSVVGVHATAQEAKESNLWGPTGEETIQIVDATDFDTLRKFEIPLSAEDTGREVTFDLLAEDDYPQELARWKRELTTWWIWQHWMVAFQRRFKDVPAPQDIFIDRLADVSPVALPLDLLHPTTFWAPERFPYTFDMEDFVENKDHPWVAQILKTMPEFRPVIMFRLCALDCQKEFTKHAR